MQRNRLTTVAIFVLLIILLATGVLADEAVPQETLLDEKIAAVLKNQTNQEELEILQDTELYDDESMGGRVITEQPVLKMYPVLWAIADQPLEEMLAAGEDRVSQRNHWRYLVLDDAPYVGIFLKGKNLVGVNEEYPDKLPNYISDIMEMTETLVVDKQEYQINGIYCFGQRTSYQEFAVYLVTDKGVFVKYYEDLYAEGQLFPEEEFRKYAAAYYAYRTSYENNYDEDGNALAGDLPFLDYLDSVYPVGNGSADTFKTNPFVLYGGIALGAVLLIGISAFFILRIRRKRKQD